MEKGSKAKMEMDNKKREPKESQTLIIPKIVIGQSKPV